jgi:hypothetical protein
MRLLFALFMVGVMASGQLATASAPPQQDEIRRATSATEGSPTDLLAMPRGKSTVIGGTISSVDPIMDQLTLKVFGGRRPMKILFDERTQVYRDGVKTSLRDLRANDHASVETMLDGTTIFARTIHMLSRSPEGECQGQVVSYEPGTGELTISESLSPELIKLRVPGGTAIVRQGQAKSAPGNAGASDLVKGTLISATFSSDNKGQGVANRIAILATPGSEVSFTGSVTYLDLRSKQFVVADAEESYKIAFDPAALPAAQNLREGTNVKVTAEFDGSHYVARAITIE